MVAFPDNQMRVREHEDGEVAKRGWMALGRGTKMFLGTVLLTAALGLWVVPGGAGDAAMQLVKLLFSAVLLVVGLLCMGGLEEDAGAPEIQIDRNARQLRVVERDATGLARLTLCHDLDTLTRITLRRGVLSACDVSGQRLFAVPVTGRRAQAAVREALDL